MQSRCVVPFPLVRVLIAIVGCALLANSCANKSVACQGVGCLHGAAVVGELPNSASQVIVEVCLNATCVSGKLLPSMDGSASASLTAKSFVADVYLRASEAGPRQLDLNVTLIDLAAPKDGDHYTVAVHDVAAGSLLASADEHVSYQNYQPNGPECGPTCKRAAITLSTP